MEQAVNRAVPCIQEQAQAKAPRRTGTLASSIHATVKPQGKGWRITVEQDDGEAPYGVPLDRPSGGRIYPRGAQALGPFQFAGETMFRRSVQQSTAHKGWWTDYPWQTTAEQCLNEGLH